MSLPALPIFVSVAGKPVILVGEGEAADAKRRLLERAGALVVGEEADARLAIVAMEKPEATVARLKARGLLVNATDRPDLCDFTLPAIVDRAPVLVAIGTGGASAGLAAALRQRLEAMLPANLGGLASALFKARTAMRARWPDAGDRRRALGVALAHGGALDPLRESHDVASWLESEGEPGPEFHHIILRSAHPDTMMVGQARALALADRVYHAADVPCVILDRARADAPRIICDAPPVEPGAGLSVYLTMRDRRV
ncbi:precorrin-2 dehydrogenase/sirohydrochlorin ferrochelatase family protein [Sphingomonas immobilis]|uniref:precorrin-2 dehydrogenase n=1 Tax=Sphingomonas immobilis TaxID=3063997 RepID=A0ABT8ZV62_9SPHN|nr:siroheme synthase [Sphingomonas sp. CA1-15]MDO7841470.1 siroheme synthase [Sphingomonas sp. CA1-15]